MTTTYTEAVDAIFALFNTAWLTNTAAVVGSVPAVRWQGVEGKTRPAPDSYWCRVSMQQVTEEQATFKSGVAPSENKRYTITGLIFVQLFCPMSDAEAMYKGRQLAIVARDAFRGQEAAGGVWFRNARINELPPEEDAYRFNVIVEYEYDELG